MIDCVYYNDYIRFFRDGTAERFFKSKGWKIVENTANSNGYNVISINHRKIKRHRILAYCFLGLENIIGTSSGEDVIDHIDNNKINNRVKNLWITTQQGNQFNRPTAKGYHWDKKSKKWRARIKLNGKSIHLGLYDTEEEAREAYLRGKEKYHIRFNSN